jgi:hypothetical protein
LCAFAYVSPELNRNIAKSWSWQMTISRWVVLGSLMAASIAWQPASGAPIGMPAGSTVWMKFSSGACPDDDGDDCAGSNQAGPNPPNGIPLSTFTDGAISATGYAEILPGTVRTFISGRGADVVASFQDTYTVGGAAAGPFDITVQFHVTGSMRPTSTQSLINGSVQAKIGTFQTFTDAALNEGLRVSPFDAGAMADTGPQTLFGLVGSIPVDITASYTKTGVNVNDMFDIAYSVRSIFSIGEIDLLNTGTISFALPPDVFLTSALAQGALAGDYNRDRAVDAADYIVWRKNDGTQDGYDTWRAHFGEMAGSGSFMNSTVPEPATLATLLTSVLILFARRRADVS